MRLSLEPGTTGPDSTTERSGTGFEAAEGPEATARVALTVAVFLTPDRRPQELNADAGFLRDLLGVVAPTAFFALGAMAMQGRLDSNTKQM